VTRSPYERRGVADRSKRYDKRGRKKKPKKPGGGGIDALRYLKVNGEGGSSELETRDILFSLQETASPNYGSVHAGASSLETRVAKGQRHSVSHK